MIAFDMIFRLLQGDSLLSLFLVLYPETGRPLTLQVLCAFEQPWHTFLPGSQLHTLRLSLRTLHVLQMVPVHIDDLLQVKFRSSQKTERMLTFFNGPAVTFLGTSCPCSLSSCDSPTFPPPVESQLTTIDE